MTDEAITIMAKAIQGVDAFLPSEASGASRAAAQAALDALRAAGYWVERWRPIEGAITADLPKQTLLFYPALAADPEFPSHPVTVSNPEYIQCGNAEKNGATHFTPLPPPPVQTEGGGV